MIGFSLIKDVESLVALSCQDLRRKQEAIGTFPSGSSVLEWRKASSC